MGRALSRAALALALTSLFLVGEAAAAPVRGALLPLELVNLSPAEGARFQRLLVRALRESAIVIVDEERTRGALQRRGAECGQQIGCLQALGREVQVDKVISLRVGRLGDTTLVRVSVFDVGRGARQGTWQELLREHSDRAVSQAMARMVAGFAPPPPALRPWYSRWWVWTIAGVAVVGSVTAAVLATRDWDGQTKYTVRLP